jgi:hypothetical protein
MTSSWGQFFDNPIAASKSIIALKEFLQAEKASVTPPQTVSQPENQDDEDQNQGHNHEEAEHQRVGGSKYLPILRSGSGNTGIPSLPWLDFMSQHANVFVSSCNEEQQEQRRLFALGRRRCESFLAQRSFAPSPLFGLTDPSTLLNLIISTEERISLLREMARSFTNDPGEMIIRYRDLEHSNSHRTEKIAYEYATLLPQISLNHGTTHKRWILSGEGVMADFQAAKRSAELIDMAGEPCGVLSHEVIGPLTIPNPLSSPQRNYGDTTWGQTSSNGSNSTQSNDLWGGLPVLPVGPASPPHASLNFVWDTSQRPFHSDALRASLRRNASFQISQRLVKGWKSAMSHPFEGKSCHYQFIFGNSSSAAIFKRNAFGNSTGVSPIGHPVRAKPKKPLTEIPAEKVIRLVQSQKLDLKLVFIELFNLSNIIS